MIQMKIVVLLCAMLMTNAVHAAPSLISVNDCELFGLAAAVWMEADGKEPQVNTMAALYAMHADLVRKREISADRAFQLIGVALLAQTAIKYIPKTTDVNAIRQSGTQVCLRRYAKTS